MPYNDEEFVKPVTNENLEKSTKQKAVVSGRQNASAEGTPPLLIPRCPQK